MFEFTTTYSLWWLVPIIVLSAGLSALLYFRNSKDEFSNGIKILLFTLRFFIFVILATFLLSPMVKSTKTEIEKPVIIFAVDNSSSMILSGDSIENSKHNLQVIQSLYKGLGAKFKIDSYTFGEELKANSSPDFSERYTNLSQCINDITDKYQYRNVGAMLLLSDGIFNRGNNPIYSSSSRFPIYSIGFGDSSVHADLAINRILYNKSVFIENTFPIEADILAKNRNNTKLKVSLFKSNKLISSKQLEVNSDNQLLKVRFNVKADKAGLQSYKIYVYPFDNEINILNNTKKININVVGDKKKVLMLYAAPHPDIAAISQVFDNSQEFELMKYKLSEFKNNIKDFNLVILYQLPNADTRSINIIKQAKKNDIPFLLVMGEQTDIQRFNSLNLGVNISSKSSSIVEAGAITNSDFAEFYFSKTFQEELNQFPPLYSPFGNYKYSNFVHTVLFQKLGAVSTHYPLIAVSDQNAYRNAFVFGEGIWKWRMMDYLHNRQHKEFDDFIMKLIRYISLTKSFQRFDIQYKRRFSQLEPIEFFATLLNANYEKVTDADIQLVIKNENGDEFPYAFSKLGDNFSLNVGQFPQGIYSFKSNVNYHGNFFETNGSFVVDDIQFESLNLQADFDLLRKISIKTGGDFYTNQQIDALINSILAKKEIVNIQRQYIQFKELIKFQWIWGLLLLLLAIEWFVRKQMGSY